MHRQGFSALGLLLLPWIANAAEFRSDERVVVGKEEVITGDLYASGATVTVDGAVLGDVVAAGREIFLNGRVEGDFIAAGQTIVVRGFVGDDVRVAGTVFHLGEEATIGDHLVAAGYSFEAEPGSRVKGPVFFAGAKALVAGTFESSLHLVATAVEIGGSVAGDTEVELSGGSLDGSPWFEGFFSSTVPPPTVPDGLTVTDSTRIGGKLSYVSPTQVEVPDVVVDDVRWEPTPETAEPGGDEVGLGSKLVSRVLTQLRRFATLFIFGLLLLWRAPSWVSGRGQQLKAAPLETFGWGLAGLLGVPVAALTVLLATVVLAVLVGALSLSGLVGLVVLIGLGVLVCLIVGFVAATGFTAQVLVSHAAGDEALQRAQPGHASSRWLPLLLGLLLYALVTSLPYVGPVLAFLVTTLGLGLVGQWVFDTLRDRREVEND